MSARERRDRDDRSNDRKSGSGRSGPAVPSDAVDADPADFVVPPGVRYAGLLGMLEGGVALAFALYLIIWQASDHTDSGAVIVGSGSEKWGYGYGTAIWFIVMGGVIAVAGWFLRTGRRWGRGPVVLANMLLVLVSYYMFTSGRPELGVPTVIVGLVGLGLLFNPTSVDWSARRYDR